MSVMSNIIYYSSRAVSTVSFFLVARYHLLLTVFLFR